MHNLRRWEKAFDRNAFAVVFNEELETASQSAATLALFFQPIFRHLGVLEDVDASFFRGEESDAPPLLNVAKGVFSSAASKVDTTPVPGLSADFVERLCQHIFFQANAELALLLARPLPPAWLCAKSIEKNG